MDNIIDLVKNHPDQINALTALCALFVSFMSIVLTFRALKLQRQHNFKSLTPIAHIRARDYENLTEVSIENVGIGPLLIEEFTATRGDQEKHNIIDWMPEGLSWATFTKLIDGRCIPADGKIVLVRYQGDLEDDSYSRRRDEIRQSLCNLAVSVKYKDIYDRPMPVEKRDLSWFARNLPNLGERVVELLPSPPVNSAGVGKTRRSSHPST